MTVRQMDGAAKERAIGGEPNSLRWLNSLRALGVILVLIYHFFPSFLPGGFIGVDIFFVVSGYLITSLLLREFKSSGKIKLLDFYRRRWRRLFPAICAMLLVCLPLSLLISSDFRVNAAQQAAATLSWTTNYYEILTGQSYEAQLLPHFFTHTWTLSVEMQYYLLWGALVTGLLFLTKNFRENRTIIFFAAAILFAVSAVLMYMFVQAGDDPTVAYMSTPSHFFPLMIGSAFAAIAGFDPTSAVKRIARLRFFRPISIAVAFASVALLSSWSFMFSFNDLRVYSWGIVAVSLISGLLILIAAMWQSISDSPEWTVTNYIGLRSYSIYLFHWPIMIIAQHAIPAPIVPQSMAGVAGSLIAIPLTFVMAELSYRYVEQRFRVNRTWKANAMAPLFVREDWEQCVSERSDSAGFDRSRKRHGKRVAVIVGVCFAVMLFILSIRAITNASFMPVVEADLKHGAMTLDIMNLEMEYGNG